EALWTLARCGVSAWPGTVVPVRLSRPLSPSRAVSSSTAPRDMGAGAFLRRKRPEACAVRHHSTYVPALWAATVTLSDPVGRGRSLRCGLDPDGHDLLVSWCPGGYRGHSCLLAADYHCPGRCLRDAVSPACPWFRG